MSRCSERGKSVGILISEGISICPAGVNKIQPDAVNQTGNVNNEIKLKSSDELWWKKKSLSMLFH